MALFDKSEVAPDEDPIPADEILAEVPGPVVEERVMTPEPHQAGIHLRTV